MKLVFFLIFSTQFVCLGRICDCFSLHGAVSPLPTLGSFSLPLAPARGRCRPDANPVFPPRGRASCSRMSSMNRERICTCSFEVGLFLINSSDAASSWREPALIGRLRREVEPRLGAGGCARAGPKTGSAPVSAALEEQSCPVCVPPGSGMVLAAPELVGASRVCT